MFPRTALLFLLLALPAAAAPEEKNSAPSGLYLQPQVYLSSGWSLTQTTQGDPVEYQTRLSGGAGMGLRVGYDFTPHVGLFGSMTLGLQDAGPYAGYGAGVTLRTSMLGSTRLYARLGARLLTPVTLLLYGTGGVGAEVFLIQGLSLGLEVDGALPLASGTRHPDSSDTEWKVSANGGPVRGVFVITWYPGL
ncbi:outer membrane beta-barrel protein [Pyxidicoccus fallax]|uniref:Outer membrane beta-barrel protein n=1 Tax=Pyxidicoccus fallax TaxID=394095 RepID=A0A848L9G3_9BACT|nr:outer membrane beta-barrel protein [Pyxidicoccus fallax]NMO15186.1 outer membrane beta-barrel protein [Pyxidicoccus fallax]NPC76885.1 outer membrane beta-barrel protein [Pyxidicoccus fallax]